MHSPRRSVSPMESGEGGWPPVERDAAKSGISQAGKSPPTMSPSLVTRAQRATNAANSAPRPLDGATRALQSCRFRRQR